MPLHPLIALFLSLAYVAWLVFVLAFLGVGRTDDDPARRELRARLESRQARRRANAWRQAADLVAERESRQGKELVKL